MFDLLKHILSGQNQFAAGGLVLMLVGSAGVFLRGLPKQVWLLIVRQVTLSITVKDEDASFQWVKEWFLEQEFLKRIRRVDADTTLRGAELALVPAPGTHWFRYKGRPFQVSFYRSKDTKGKSQRRLESLTFETLGRRQELLREFVTDIVACHHRKMEKTSLLYAYDDYWTRVQAYAPRLLDSVILRQGEKEALVQDLRKFRAARDRYTHLGVPYHRGYLFYGPPGTGKTSLVSALAAAFGMSIYVVNLTGFNDRSLKSAMNDVPENSVILFEDIDCMGASNRRIGTQSHNEEERKSADAGVGIPASMRVTLSGLLNVLDGFHAPENVVFVMTTNDIGALDPALLRPGRIDYRLFMGHASDAQKAELYLRFFPGAKQSDAVAFANAHGETMAEFQGRLLRLEDCWDRQIGLGDLLKTESADCELSMLA